MTHSGSDEFADSTGADGLCAAGLSSWDFLQELDFALDTNRNSLLPQKQPKQTANASSEVLKEKNRQAQKRARQKKKERSESVDAHLAETTRQLHELKLRQSQLEARNQLLEKLALLHKQPCIPLPGLPQSNQAGLVEEVWKILVNMGLHRTEQGAMLLTVHGSPEEMHPEDLSKMHLTDFARLYSAYVRKQAECLLDIQSSSDSYPASLSQLRCYNIEIAALCLCYTMSSPHTIEVVQSLNMQDGTVYQDALPPTAYDELLAALKYTDSQQQDMLHLKRLLCGKIGQLSRDRAAIMSHMSRLSESSHPPQVFIDFKYTDEAIAETKEVAEKLSTNRAEERRVYLYYGACFKLRIQSSVQHATSMVHSYPRSANFNVLLETVAQQQNEPSRDSLMEAGRLDDLQHAANWEAVVQYVDNIEADNLQESLVKFAAPC